MKVGTVSEVKDEVIFEFKFLINESDGYALLDSLSISQGFVKETATEFADKLIGATAFIQIIKNRSGIAF